ncbi:uncharacterized protein ATNIH1004_008073 [Aspergillus tanneri]|uniref:Uncharacterized protein n=1 Tax=Aspergillus tanneri TaxID=1220188 RepID=A0A5M9MMC6_9EURO|nr:uncharacterized protein ATNIH1004_008073 [Aspergillus tanneri]KAA8643877.1 hypothetical protein ATNIH1004_008073 [Aspergillus tanneri]
MVAVSTASRPERDEEPGHESRVSSDERCKVIRKDWPFCTLIRIWPKCWPNGLKRNRPNRAYARQVHNKQGAHLRLVPGETNEKGQINEANDYREHMELPTYTVPKSLLSPQPAPPSRGGHLLRRSLSEVDGLDCHSRATRKRRQTRAESTSGRTELEFILQRQDTISESLLSPLSHADIALQAPINRDDGPDRHNIPATTSHSGLSIGVHSQSKTDENHSPPSSSLNAKQSEELLFTGPHSCQSSDESPDLAFPFPTPTKDLRMKYDCFLELSNKDFFPTPSMTDIREEAPTSILSWNSATNQPILLDEAMPAAGQDEAGLGSLLDTSASTEARLSHVLKAVAAAGFESLDNAVVAYYAKTLKDDEWLGQEQRLNRIRRLPVLLKELHLASEGWCQWQRRSFQEQVIKSTEDILIAELEDHLTARADPDHGQPNQAFKHKARDEAILRLRSVKSHRAKPSAMLTGGIAP